ncbi:unnamed protein product [Owenia fusiformis]|uniref:Lipase domain-containing protein n=1 Tax=Owenia fusiformis TaxID=6347 RepID=A0A8S4NE80_OWEFU|nr:unnamed protein product [Owenia fusiformis]
MLFVSVLVLVFGFRHGEAVCTPPCGCYNTTEAPWIDTDDPETWETQQLKYELYTRSNRENAIPIRWDNIPNEYDATKPTRFVIHGWWGRTPLSHWTNNMKSALLTSFDVNVIIVDWTEGASHAYYPQSAMNTRVIGGCTGHLVETLVNAGNTWNDFHCIGHSLGGQVCGFAGKKTEGRMARVTGMDPAGPAFDITDPRGRIDRGDAVFVDNLHTNANNDYINLGLGHPVGHADFYPNKGGPQPPCDDFNCDHSIAHEYMRTSILNGCPFNAFPCSSNEDADNGRCDTCSEGNCQRMGYYANTMPGRGTFFLRTVRAYPYCAA